MRILYLSPYAPERCGIGDYTAGFVRSARALGPNSANKPLLVMPRKGRAVTKCRLRGRHPAFRRTAVAAPTATGSVRHQNPKK